MITQRIQQCVRCPYVETNTSLAIQHAAIQHDVIMHADVIAHPKKIGIQKIKACLMPFRRV